ncbi:hypothetical protein [Methanobrevibacter sp.]
MKKILFVLLLVALLALGISANFAADSLTNTTDLTFLCKNSPASASRR